MPPAEGVGTARGRGRGAYHAEVHVGGVELQVDLPVDGGLAVLVVVLPHLRRGRGHGDGGATASARRVGAGRSGGRFRPNTVEAGTAPARLARRCALLGYKYEGTVPSERNPPCGSCLYRPRRVTTWAGPRRVGYVVATPSSAFCSGEGGALPGAPRCDSAGARTAACPAPPCLGTRRRLRLGRCSPWATRARPHPGSWPGPRAHHKHTRAQLCSWPRSLVRHTRAHAHNHAAGQGPLQHTCACAIR